MHDYSDEHWSAVRQAAEEVLEESRRIRGLTREQRDRLRLTLEALQRYRFDAKAGVTESEARRQDRQA